MQYQIANFIVDTRQFKITESGVPVSVEPKVFDLIVYLIKNRQHLVSRDELFAQIWADREVSDTTLSNHIKSARKVFGDNGELQNVIQTIRGRGYQFVAHVETRTTQSNHTTSKFGNNIYATPAPSKSAIPRHASFRTKALILLSVLSILIVGIWWQSQHNWSDIGETDKRPYIIVLPFGVSSIDDQKWQPFADQMTREVIRKLTHVSDLRVVPASSAFSFQHNTSYSAIREKLPDLTYVLEATVNINEAADIRITSDMLDIKSGELVWDNAFDSKVDNHNFFSIQSDIASSVANSLKLVLGDNEHTALQAFPTDNLAAYELYVAGQQQLNLLNHESLKRSIALFEQATDLDQRFALAYVAKANAYRLIMSYYEKPIDVLPDVIDAVRDALAIAPDSAEALSSMGLAYVFAWRWEDAWNMLSAAKQRNPRLALTELGFAIYYSGIGDTAGVYRSLEKANQLDPLNIELADWGHWSLAMVGELDAAIKWGKEKMQLHPEVGMLYSGASVSASLKQDHQRAISLAQTGVELDPHSPYAFLALAQAYGHANQTEKIASLMAQAEKL